MSQAECAPSTGAGTVRSGNLPGIAAQSPGKSDTNSRRQLLAGLAFLPILSAAATAAPVRREIDSRKADARFWAAHDIWKALETDMLAAIRANPHMQDADLDAWSARESAAFKTMMDLPPDTLPGLYAKMQAISDDPDNLTHAGAGYSVFDIVRWNLERIIMGAQFQ